MSMSINDDRQALTPRAGAASSPREVRRVAISSYLGNTIEYYDFILYASSGR
jgi:hypothetical protein